ncbi:PLP-dependent aminotransferase family protein [Phreatobacter stygius]|uniref:PLP-dependent aminotransferase family protein n=1 Tax=Phreatobacter stygius TaxID=1940610 RepID=A0A4D7B6I1_9HYPH|nr:PLP-dependent aminotransferase family protein [Phreatobacter stygius]QCI66695.1 PLP-dependent aminotransferase family protein [Phreatobacter stygius]
MTQWVPDLSAGGGPKYLAIASALAADIRSGRLKPGDALPPQRELARLIGVDLTTVTRAFNEARRDGLIGANGRRGSFVLGPGSARRTIPPVAPVAVDWRMNLPPTPARLHLADRFDEGFRAVLQAPDAAERLQYQQAGGALPDRMAGAEWLKGRLGELAEDRVVIAAGAQNALASICRLLLGSGDAVVTGELTFPGMKSVAERLGVGLIPLAGDALGLDPDRLEALCRVHRPKALYCVPTMDNPTTVTLSVERRAALGAIARRHGLWIIEDDAYGDLRSEPMPAIARLAPDRTWHIASLAKSVSPALRVAYVAVPGTGDGLRLGAEIHAACVMAPPLNAALASLWVRDGSLAEIVAAMRGENRARQEIMTEVLAGHDLAGDPEAPHAWLTLPDRWEREAFSTALRQAGLAVVSSDAFAVTDRPPNAVRLSLGSLADLGALRRAARLIDALLTGSGQPLAAFV